VTWTLQHGDCLLGMLAMDATSVDAIITDPPYGLGFMGREWDRGVPGPHYWEAALRVAKPGAHLLAFGGTRTFHRLACAIEDAGWELRDCLSWLYGSGFPKSRNGPWGGTALKPAWEPILMARKPLVGTVAANVTQFGTGGLNVDGCRVGYGHKTLEEVHREAGSPTVGGEAGYNGGFGPGGEPVSFHPLGRWPANVALDDAAAAMLDAQSGELTSGANPTRRGTPKFRSVYGAFQGQETCEAARGEDRGGASRFFYCAKASRSEREAGLDGMPRKRGGAEQFDSRWKEGTGQLRSPLVRNHHPTVKPIALMRWLARLVTPPGGLVLDPFAGSGTTGCAALLEGMRFVGFESVAEYFAIARQRIQYWQGAA
jgi:DNA modification methylase